jgi:hypothetical protein
MRLARQSTGKDGGWQGYHNLPKSRVFKTARFLSGKWGQLTEIV